jgi:Rho GTPase-activating protein 1
LSASALPDPQEVSYDLLLQYVTVQSATTYPHPPSGEFYHISTSLVRLYCYHRLPCLISAFSPVESDYTVVFFAAGSRHAPNWNWVWKAYRSLSRKYRKNLKRLVSGHLYLLKVQAAELQRSILYTLLFSRKVSEILHSVELSFYVP